MILKGRPCHQHDPFGFILQGPDPLCPECPGIFDIVRLVDDQQVQIDAVIDLFRDPSHILVIGHGSPAIFFPGGESLLPARPVQKIGCHIAEFYSLPAPVDQHRGRAHDEKAASGVFSVQMRHRRQCLYGLAQAHLISQQRFFLFQDIARSEGLIGAEIPFETGQIKGMFFDLRRQLRRNAAVDHLLFRLCACQLLEKSVKCRAVFFIILPGGGSRHRQSFLVHLYKGFRSVIQAAAEELGQSACCKDSSLPLCAPGKKPLQTAPDLHCLRHRTDFSRQFIPDRPGIPADHIGMSVDRKPMNQFPGQLRIFPAVMFSDRP